MIDHRSRRARYKSGRFFARGRDARSIFDDLISPFVSHAAFTAIAILSAVAAGGPAAAQVVFDGTLGGPGAAPIENGTGFSLVEQNRGQTVAGGGRTHVFHSFSQFDINPGETVEFRTTDGVDTILSRITDNGPSSIAGDLRVRTENGIGAPDLFLLNPNGMLFSGSTRIDLAGAFVASSAEAVQFADGTAFSATSISAPLPTTATLPQALVFGSRPGGDVEFNDGRVQSFSSAGREKAVSLTFVGREIRATGLGGVIADDATLQMAAAGNGAVQIPMDLSTLPAQGEATGALRFDGGGAIFSLQTNSTLSDQGRVVIRGGELVLLDAQILSGGDGSQGADTIAVDLGLGGTLSLQGSSARIDSRSSATAGPGGIRIDAERVDVRAGASIGLTQNDDAPGSGRLSIRANEVALDGASAEIKTTLNGGGDGGPIEIETEELQLSNDARILSRVLTGASGTGGAIDIDAERVELTSLADILSVTVPGSLGDGGSIEVEGQTLSLSGFSRILAASAGSGAGGDLVLNFSQIMLGEGTFVATGPLLNPEPEERFTGGAGALAVTAENLTLREGAQVSTTIDGEADAGDLTLRISDLLLVEGRLEGVNRASGVFARSGLGTGSTATGLGGTIDLEAARVELAEGGQIGIESLGDGNAGAALLRVGSISLSAGSAISGSATGGGATGAIQIDSTGDITLSGGSTIQSSAPIPPGATSPADPLEVGNIALRAGGGIALSDAAITTESARQGSGDISLSAGRSITLVDSDVTTTIDSASGRGGDIALDSPVLAVAAGGVRANANGTNGAAGNVVVRASEGIILIGEDLIQARADRGIAGDVVLAGPETNIAGELAGLAARAAQSQDTVRDPCAARTTRAGRFEILPQATPPPTSAANDSLSSQPSAHAAASGTQRAGCARN